MKEEGESESVPKKAECGYEIVMTSRQRQASFLATSVSRYLFRFPNLRIFDCYHNTQFSPQNVNNLVQLVNLFHLR